MVARFVRDEEVVGSNPATPTEQTSSSGPVSVIGDAALISFLAHLPIALIEGIVLAFTVSFLARVKPELLGRTTQMSTSAANALRHSGTD